MLNSRRMRGALQVGEILCGRYQLLKALGEGGMGAVFLAERLKLAKRVVIKTLHEEFGRDPTFRARFKREARVTSKIEHDNIVNVLDVDEHEGFLFYVMEYLEGEDLSQTLEREKRLAWPRARGIALQLCAALAAAHRKRIVHRDLKPSNCFLVRRDDEEAGDLLKIIDFGIAQLLGTSSRRTGGEGSTERTKLTLPGEVFGTVLYMSPEHFAGQPTDRRTDVYAVGCILYQMLTGEVPIAYGPSFSHALANEIPAPPSQRAPDAGIPGAVDHLVLKALAKRPEDRFPDMDTLLAALEHAGDRLEPRASPRRASRHRSPVDSRAQTVRRTTVAAPPQPRSLDRRARTRRWVLLAITTFAAAVALLAATCRRAGISDDQGGGLADVSAPPAAAPFHFVPVLTPTRAVEQPASTSPPTVEPALPSPVLSEPPKSALSKPPGRPTAGTKRTPPHQTAPCQEVRTSADTARRKQRWTELRDLARQRDCWPSPKEARKLETKARMELGDFEGCLSVGKGLTDKEVQNWLKLCQERAKG